MLLHADSPVKIRHSLAGRARLYVAELKHDQTRLTQTLGYLRSVPGIRRAQGNAATGSILVQFEESRISLEDVLSLLREFLTEPPGEAGPWQKAPEQAPAPHEPEDLSLLR